MRPDELVDGYERSLLGGVLWEPLVPLPPLRPEEFYLERHRIIWQVMMELERPTLLLLVERLRQTDQLEFSGGLPYLVQLFEEGTWALPTLLVDYAQQVRDAATRRELRALGSELESTGLSRDQVEERLAAIPRPGLVRNRDIPTLWDQVQGFWIAGAVRLGIEGIDRLIGRLFPGDLVVIGARPSHGKTAIIVSMALRIAAEDGVSVSICSLEMPATGILRRFLGAQARVRLSALRTGALGPTEFELAEMTVEWLARQPLTIRDVADLGSKRADRVLAAIQADPALVIMLDHLQEVITEDTESRALALGQFCGALKEIALRDRKVLVLTAQLSRGADRQEQPSLAYLKESGGIEEKADVVILLDYPAKTDSGRPPTELDAYVAKNRDGATGKVTLPFLPEIGKVG